MAIGCVTRPCAETRSVGDATAALPTIGAGTASFPGANVVALRGSAAGAVLTATVAAGVECPVVDTPETAADVAFIVLFASVFTEGVLVFGVLVAGALVAGALGAAAPRATVDAA